MQWHRQTRPTVLPVSTEALHDGLNLIADQDVELTRDAERKALSAAYEFEDQGEVALINQTIHVRLDDPGECSATYRLPIGPVAEATQAVAHYRTKHGDERTLHPDKFVLVAGPRPLFQLRSEAMPHDLFWDGTTLFVEYIAGFGPDHTTIPADIAQAIISQTALMQDAGWDLRRGHSGLSPHTARIAARYRGVAV